jgi:methionine-S-sulfoxide reductase
MLAGALALAAPLAQLAAQTATDKMPAPKTDKMAAKGEAVAIFAGGCFWCVESDFDGVPGVLRTISGYTGGRTKNPNYNQVTAGASGHREAVQIFFDPNRVRYAQLLEVFWRSVDPTDGGGQFCDRGESYTTGIFATDAGQRKAAEASKARLVKSGVLKNRKLVTPILDAGPFYAAEEYHQNYYKRNPLRYNLYRYGCGRDKRLKELWGKDAMRGITKH